MQAKYIHNKINNPKKENREIFKGTVSKGIVHQGGEYAVHGCRDSVNGRESLAFYSQSNGSVCKRVGPEVRLGCNSQPHLHDPSH